VFWTTIAGGKRPRPRGGSMETTYAQRLEAELAAFANRVDISALPGSHNYVANRYWLPRMQALGFSSIDDFYLNYLQRVAEIGQAPRRVLSVGAGNCDHELRLAGLVRERGLAPWEFVCLDINPAMLARGQAGAEGAGLAGQLVFFTADANTWQPQDGEFGAVMASHSLHHIVELELLFDKIRRALAPGGYFLVNDMIGRNGHQRWPEVMKLMKPLWRVLEDRHKFNHHTQMVEKEFINWDYSREGFEGIRAQDILPLLLRTFAFEMFFGFANLIDPFIDRAFGFNFNPELPTDRQFLDLVVALDDHLLELGEFKPTHALAALTALPQTAEPRCHKHLTPGFCVRLP
jgi:ubiquinone/menaquinone biosynthesis C-methylase UbiE